VVVEDSEGPRGRLVEGAKDKREGVVEEA